jgi:hypothetical protein
MSANDMFAELEDKYRHLESEELLRIVRSTEDYRPEAVALAREVLSTRDLKQEGIEIEAVVQELEKESASRAEQAQEPLGAGLKIVCFLFCGLPGILIAIVQGKRGRIRATNEAWFWVGCGWLSRIAIVLLRA